MVMTIIFLALVYVFIGMGTLLIYEYYYGVFDWKVRRSYITLWPLYVLWTLYWLYISKRK